MEADAAAARPLIATLVVSKAQGGLPGPGFFDCARRVGRFDGDPSGPDGCVLRGRVQYGRRILARGRRSRGDGYPSSAAIPNIGIKMTLRQGFPKVIGAYGN